MRSAAPERASFTASPVLPQSSVFPRGAARQARSPSELHRRLRSSVGARWEALGGLRVRAVAECRRPFAVVRHRTSTALPDCCLGQVGRAKLAHPQGQSQPLPSTPSPSTNPHPEGGLRGRQTLRCLCARTGAASVQVAAPHRGGRGHTSVCPQSRGCHASADLPKRCCLAFARVTSADSVGAAAAIDCCRPDPVLLAVCIATVVSRAGDRHFGHVRGRPSTALPRVCPNLSGGTPAKQC